MNDNSKIELTIVIPNYNNACYLHKCVESIASQSYKGAYEVIIVDDCSNDDSIEVIKDIEHKYSFVHSILLETNGQVSNARNTGMNAAKGKKITFLDTDDFYFDEDKIQREMNVFSLSKRSSKKTIAFSKTVQVDINGKNPIYLKQFTRFIGLYYSLLFDLSSRFVMRDYIVDLEELKKCGGYNTCRNLFEDYELLIKLSRNHRFVYSGGLGTGYRNSNNGLSKRDIAILESEKKKVIFEEIERRNVILKPLLYILYFVVFYSKKVLKRLIRR